MIVSNIWRHLEDDFDPPHVDGELLLTNGRRNGKCVTLDIIKSFSYKRVIFHYPATIVIWADGTKTVVKCMEGDEYDPEKGLALCFMKRALGNNGALFHSILKNELNRLETYDNCKEVSDK